MAVPKKRKSYSRTRIRRSCIKVKCIDSVVCNNCGGYRIPHNICQKCGFYKGKLIKTVKNKREFVKQTTDQQ